MNKRLITIVLLAALTLAADQASKAWARTALKGKPTITVVEDYLFLGYYENKGVAFSLGSNLPYRRVVLIVFGLIVLIFVWRMVRRIERRQRTADVAFALIAGGALGNIIDRIWMGRVVDFIVMHWRHRHYWPAYNVADIALVVGVGLLLIAIGVTSPAKATAAGGAGPGQSRKRKARKGKR